MGPVSIRLAILGVLQLAKPWSVPATQLRADVNRLVRPDLSAGDLSKHLAWLKANSMADFRTDPLDPDNADARKWQILEAGENALRT